MPETNVGMVKNGFLILYEIIITSAADAKPTTMVAVEAFNAIARNNTLFFFFF